MAGHEEFLAIPAVVFGCCRSIRDQENLCGRVSDVNRASDDTALYIGRVARAAEGTRRNISFLEAANLLDDTRITSLHFC